MRRLQALLLLACCTVMGLGRPTMTAAGVTTNPEAGSAIRIPVTISPVSEDLLTACQKCQSSWDGSLHTFVGSCVPTEITGDFAGCYECDGSESCHDDLLPGYCAQHHVRCDAGLLKHDLQLALRSLDVEAVLRLITNGFAATTYVEDSGTIQISCQGALVEEVLVPEAFQAQLIPLLRTM
jgi:hypothetical protein